MSFEDPTLLFKCSQADCTHDRAGGTPLCARHLREQEQSSAGYCEPELEARVARIRTEDDEHPHEKKIYNDDGTSEWVPDPDWQPPGRLYVGPDPDMNGPLEEAYQPTLKWQTQPSVALSGMPEDPAPTGVWVAYHSDWNGFAIFDDEVAALRHAVANSMSIGFSPFGQELGGGRYPGGS